MTCLRILVAFLLVWVPLCADAQDVVVAPSRNVELISIVCNIADGYTPEEDGYTLAPDASWMKPYTMFGAQVARHRAVRLVKKMDRRGVWLDYDLVGLSFDEFDFSRPGGLLRPEDDLDRPIVKRFFRAMDDLAAEDYIRSYFYETYPGEFGRIARNSEAEFTNVHLEATKIPEFMNEQVAGGFRVVPALHIELYTSFSEFKTDTLGRDVVVSWCGLAIPFDNDDTRTSFDIYSYFFSELFAPFVTRTMDAPEHEAEALILQELFPGVEAAARSTYFYDDWRSCFGETIKMALSKAMNFPGGYMEQYTVGEGYFLLVEPVAGILQREFCGSGIPFSNFYPTLVARLAEILKNDENK